MTLVDETPEASEMPRSVSWRAMRALSFAATPVIVLVSTSLTLFLNNQRDLDYNPGVLIPLVAAAAALWGVGIALASLRGRVAELAVWGFYAAGPFYLAYKNLRTESDPPFWLPVLFGLVLVGSAIALTRFRVPSARASELFAVMAVLLIGLEVFRYATEFDPPESAASNAASPAPSSSRPNIYHLLFDGYQGDVFAARLSEALVAELGGFVHFPATTAVFDQTTVSLASIFSGREFDFVEPLSDYQYSAFNGEASLLSDLRRAGYHVTAYTRKFYPFQLDLFHDVVQHMHNADRVSEKQVRGDFVRVWIFATLPKTLSKRLLSEQETEAFGRNTFLPYVAPIRSIVSMRKIIEAEASASAAGRYTFIHLMLPHQPYVLEPDCSYDVKASETSAEAAYACAALALREFVTRLDELGRFDDAMIVVQGDHGGFLRLVDGKLEKAPQRSPSTVLLVKPFGRSRDQALQTSSLWASTLDVAWLLRRALAGPDDDWLRELERRSQDRERNFYVGAKGSQFRKYRVADGELVAEGMLAYDARPRAADAARPPSASFPADTVVEAEDAGLSAAVDVRSDRPNTSGRYVMNGDKAFHFEVTAAGRYVLRGRVVAPSGNNDSSYVTMGGKRATWVIPIRQQWEWFEYRVPWQLEPGRHALVLGYREPIFLDQVQLARQFFAPDTIVEAEAGHLDAAARVGSERDGVSGQHVAGRVELEFETQPEAAYRVRARVLSTQPDASLEVWLEGLGKHLLALGAAEAGWRWIDSEIEWQPGSGRNRIRLTASDGVFVDSVEVRSR